MKTTITTHAFDFWVVIYAGKHIVTTPTRNLIANWFVDTDHTFN